MCVSDLVQRRFFGGRFAAFWGVNIFGFGAGNCATVVYTSSIGIHPTYLEGVNMITQETIYIGSTPIRRYSNDGRFADVNGYGQVFGYQNADAMNMDDGDFTSWEHRSTNGANEIAIAYVLQLAGY